jgi:hypothetical protein
MGAGNRVRQFEHRFYQGEPSLSDATESCNEGGESIAAFGERQISSGADGYELVKGGRIVGIFEEASIESERAVFKLSTGMLLEVTSSGIREIFSKSKAGLHGLTASDGSLYGGPPGKPSHNIRLESESPELVDLYSRYFEDVYDRQMHRDLDRGYPRVMIGDKMAFYDLKNYGAKTGLYTWNVPRAYLDREGAAEWLKCFFSGDGTVKLVCAGRDYDIAFDSTCREGLEQIQALLLDEFGIRSTLKPRPRKARPGRRPGYNLRVRDEVEFAEEIGSYKEEHIERLEKILKKKGRR